MFPFQNLPPIGNQLAWKVFLLVQNLMLKKIINHYRTILSLPLINNVWSYYNQRSIMGLSKDLVPIPQPYQKSTIQVNYFYADHTEPLPDSLEAFIHQYGPPVYIGFGSMVNKDQNELEAIIHAIVNELKLPVILSKGWANFKLSQNNEKVYIASRVNHLKLFPKVLLAIHHGGPGTLSTVLKAGVPQILVPHMFDQFYWGQRLYELGLTTRPLNRSKLKKDAVIGSIRKTLNNTQIKKNIIEYKQKFMNANGIDELIDQQLLNIDGINL
jgi:UDP:flavonoid glycosyltransferase YjiC (YdhE family)